MQIATSAALFSLVAVAAPATAATGVQLFAERCAMCHQASGAGIPGAFPRIGGRAATIAQSAPGRRYLALLMLNGMTGTIVVDGQSISGLMPSMAALPDADLAAVLSHALQLGSPVKGKKPAPFTPAEVAAFRKEAGIGPGGVAGERAKLARAGLLP